MKVGKYMTAEPVGIEPEAYIVSTARTGDKIGLIEWYKPFREYTFDAESGAIFSHECLKSLAVFVEWLNNGRIKQRPACQFDNAGCEGLPFRHNGERSCPQCVALYELARKNGMPASGRHG